MLYEKNWDKSSPYGQNEVIEIFDLPSYLKGRSHADKKSLKEAKKRRAHFPEMAARRFSKRSEDRIYGFTPDARLRNAITKFVRRAGHEIVTRDPRQNIPYKDCRPRNWLLKIDPDKGVWPGDDGDPIVRESDIFDRVILPRDDRGHHYIPLEDKRLWLPLSQYVPLQLDALCDAAEKLGSVITTHFSERPSWRTLEDVRVELSAFDNKPGAVWDAPLSLSSPALAELHDINLQGKFNPDKIIKLLPTQVIEFNLAAKAEKKPIRAAYTKQLREEFEESARAEIYLRYQGILPRYKLAKAIENYGIHHVTPVSLGGDNESLVLIPKALHARIHENIDRMTEAIQATLRKNDDRGHQSVRKELSQIPGVSVGADRKIYIRIPSFAGRKICVPQLVEFEHRHHVGFLDRSRPHQLGLTLG